MTTIPYSAISQLVNLNLKDSNATRNDFLFAIAQSYEYITKVPSVTTKVLHNKYIELGKSKYGAEGIDQYTTTSDLRMLERDFEKDPSDMGCVLRLAIEYAASGRQQRAFQLLSRIAASGYVESATATELIARLNTGEALK